MEVIGDLVRNIAIIILLAIFVEMLLPNNDFARYLQLVMGLFIIITILTPIVSFLDRDDLIDTSLWKVTSDRKETESILTSGKEINSISREKAIQEYVSRLEKQINALASLVPGVDNVDSIVTIDEGNDAIFGRISKIEIMISPEKRISSVNQKSAINVENVEIEKNKDGYEDKENNLISQIERNNISTKIVKAISNFYGVQEEHIEISWQ